MEAWRKELYHHGIKGQKWGERNYQNPDGSLTAAGRLRYGSASKDKGYKEAVAASKINGRLLNDYESDKHTSAVLRAARNIEGSVYKHNKKAIKGDYKSKKAQIKNDYKSGKMTRGEKLKQLMNANSEYQRQRDKNKSDYEAELKKARNIADTILQKTTKRNVLIDKYMETGKQEYMDIVNELDMEYGKGNY